MGAEEEEAAAAASRLLEEECVDDKPWAFTISSSWSARRLARSLFLSWRVQRWAGVSVGYTWEKVGGVVCVCVCMCVLFAHKAKHTHTYM
jgi:hypothetical protein